MCDIGIVGCGVIGTRFAAAVDAHDRYELAAACDLDGGDLVSFGEATRVQAALEAIHASDGDRVALDG